ncbi:rRNA pseudouridine synthase [bacterium]|nr:rRNA pseudouridine synthase [bacterium]
MTVRIAKFIADTGVASRRDAEQMIADGRVALNGETVTSPVCFINPDVDTVTIDGVVVKPRDVSRLYAFHKPLNTMTTTRDPAGRKTIYDCLAPQYKNLRYVGRLDYKTTGLLLMTDDGELAQKLSHPSSRIERTYIATVNSTDFSKLDAARAGITVDGIKYRPMKIDVIGTNVLRVTVTEGKKNEVRIVLRACRCPVRHLRRISFGPIVLGNMAVGEIKQIPQKTIDELLKSI